MLISRDLSDLWLTPLDGLGLAACANSPQGEQMQDTTAMKYAASYLAAPRDQYFNSGLLLADLRRWREIDVESRSATFFLNFGHVTICPDQDALNFIFSGQYKKLSGCWNVQCPSTVSRIFTRQTCGGPTRQFEGVRHFVGAYKPWNGGVRHPFLLGYIFEVRRVGWLRPLEWPGYLIIALTPPRVRHKLPGFSR
jgi:lipopolysaccharide biosynthesis glycosyltransferase